MIDIVDSFTPNPDRQRDPRRLIVWQGDSGWESLLSQTTPDTDLRFIHIGQTPIGSVATVPAVQARNLLGSEFDVVFYDAAKGIDPDALGIVSGCIPAGGILVLRLPASTNSVAIWKSPYHQRFLKLLQSQANIEFCQTLDADWLGDVHVRRPPESGWMSSDQAMAVDAVMHVLTGGRRKPAILIADRGRGKSAALGIAAKQILGDPTRRIVVTGRNRSSAGAVFRHAEADHAAARERMQWIELDRLLSLGTDADLVLVDEAAGIPLHLLESLLHRFPRIAMATTVHGYEGSGRGFLLRFRQSLDRLTRGWKRVDLQEPIRWRQNDPLEQQIDELLMLSAGLSDPKDTGAANDIDVRIRVSSGVELARDETELNTVFGLLVAAHYRTRPSDLKHLLDDNAVVIYRLQLGKSGAFETVGVLVGVREPAPDDRIAAAIVAGDRRPPGLVLAELLVSQMGVTASVKLNMLRVQRIVMHPALRRRGLGSRLLRQFCEDHGDECSLVGTNFSLDPDLVKFWRQAGFAPVRLGSRRSPNSGAVSGLFLRHLDSPGRQACEDAIKRFAHEVPAALPRLHRTLDPKIIQALLWKNPDFDWLPAQDIQRLLDRFASNRLPEQAIPATLVSVVLAGLSGGVLEDAELCIERVLLGKTWDDCRSLTGAEGRHSGERRLRRSCEKLLQRWGFDADWKN